jgi:hypothetical protein
MTKPAVAGLVIQHLWEDQHPGSGRSASMDGEVIQQG